MLCKSTITNPYILTKQETYVKIYTNYYICIKFDSFCIKKASGMPQIAKSLITSLCTYLMSYNNYCYTQHTFYLGVTSPYQN